MCCRQQGEQDSLSVAVRSTDKKDVHFFSGIPDEAVAAIAVQGQATEMCKFYSLIMTDERHGSIENITVRNPQSDAGNQTLLVKRIKSSTYRMHYLQYRTCKAFGMHHIPSVASKFFAGIL